MSWVYSNKRTHQEISRLTTKKALAHPYDLNSSSCILAATTAAPNATLSSGLAVFISGNPLPNTDAACSLTTCSRAEPPIIRIASRLPLLKLAADSASSHGACRAAVMAPPGC